MLRTLPMNNAISLTSADLTRKLNLLKRAGLFGADTKGCVIERACSPQDLKAAYQLVHEVFVHSGYMQPVAEGIRLRVYEVSPDTATFIAKKDGKVVGVLSVVADSVELGLPSDLSFKEELDEKRAKNLKLCEMTNQVISTEYRKSSVMTELMRAAIAYIVTEGFDLTLATVSPNHSNFYKVLGFSAISTVRSYSEKLHDPVIALCMDVSLFKPSVPIGLVDPFVYHLGVTCNTFITDASDWTKRARECFLNIEMLKTLVTDHNFLKVCQPIELEYLKDRWGQELYKQVAA